MKIKKKNLGRYLLLLILLFLAIGSGRFYFGNSEYRFLTGRVENVIARKDRKMASAMAAAATSPMSDAGIRHLSGRIDFQSLAREGITVVVYQNDSLVFWSDKSFEVPYDLHSMTGSGPVRFIHNGYFLVRYDESSGRMVVGLQRLYSLYDIRNALVKTGFPAGFGLPDAATLIPTPEVSDYNVSDRDGQYLFSIGFPQEKQNSFLLILPLMAWLLFLIILLILTDDLLRVISLARGWITGLLLKAGLYLGAYWLITEGFYPLVFSKTMLFNSSLFSLGSFIPSMGHLLFMSVLLTNLARTAYQSIRVHSGGKVSPARDFLNFAMLLLPGTAMVLLFHQLLFAMISHTNLVFEGYRVSQISILSVAGIFCLFLLVMVPSFYIIRLNETFRHLKFWAFFPALFINLLLFADVALFGVRTGFAVALFYAFLVILLRYHAVHKTGLFFLSASFSIVFSLYLTYYITVISLQNEVDSLKVSAVTLASTNDPLAENLLISMSPSLKSDTVLTEIMGNEYFRSEEADRVSDHLLDKYFGGYWTNYDFSVILCNQRSPLLINGGSDVAESCFRFFEESITAHGQPVTGTPFWFMDNRMGRPSYLGVLYYDLPSGGRNGLFIELYSFVNAFREGYPELLTDNRYLRPVRFREYSIAKYIDGVLVLNTGSYSYPMRDNDLSGTDREFHVVRLKGFDHFIYRQEDVTVVQSRREVPFISRVVSFAYVYIFIQILSGIPITLHSRNSGWRLKSLTLSQKLQAAFAVVILVTFTGIATGAANLSIEQYRQRHYDSLREKAGSLYIELEHKLQNEDVLEPDWTDGKYLSLNDLLVKFSNVFFTDINLYDSNGSLLATSRPEIFMRDLTSKRMDRLALANLSTFSETEYISRERIGELEYLSIYVPFYNERSELLAYLNVPYFGMQTALSAETTNLLVAIVNFSLLMIIAAMSIAVLLSERITSPIRMLGQVLSSVRLGRKSERLSYPARDEIGEMVSQYNKMVEELEASTLKLAASEREFAWREMAKQIAHEIKNPLTPMKLNVQQLEKSWKDGKPGFEKKLEKFTRNQIEHIDTLSSIATAFSNFARMPGANPVQIDLLDQIKSTLELFKSSGNILFRISCVQTTRVIVLADREHLNSIFSNLVKNAIQAIPPERSGLIKVAVELAGDRVVVKISDNGTGIPADLQQKLFTPHFTTKSSGSGLGLSIVRRLVEGMGGEIGFESEPDAGTTFAVTLPVLYTVERTD